MGVGGVTVTDALLSGESTLNSPPDGVESEGAASPFGGAGFASDGAGSSSDGAWSSSDGVGSSASDGAGFDVGVGEGGGVLDD